MFYQFYLKPFLHKLSHLIKCNDLYKNGFMNDWNEWGSTIVASEKYKYFWDSNNTTHLKWQN